MKKIVLLLMTVVAILVASPQSVKNAETNKTSQVAAEANLSSAISAKTTSDHSDIATVKKTDSDPAAQDVETNKTSQVAAEANLSSAISAKTTSDHSDIATTKKTDSDPAFLYIVLNIAFIVLIFVFIQKRIKKKYRLTLEDFFSIDAFLDKYKQNPDKLEIRRNLGRERIDKLRVKCKKEENEKCKKEKLNILKTLSKDENSNAIRELSRISFIFGFISVAIGVFMGWSMLLVTNVHNFLFVSVVIPFFILIGLLIMSIPKVRQRFGIEENFNFYSWVLEHEESWKWYQWIEKKWLKNKSRGKKFQDIEDREQVLRFFSQKQLPKFGILYAGGLWLSIQLIFLSKKVEFVFLSTYDLNEKSIISLFSLPWSWYFQDAVPEFVNNINVSDHQMALFMTMTIIYWIILPRVLVWWYKTEKLRSDIEGTVLGDDRTKRLFCDLNILESESTEQPENREEPERKESKGSSKFIAGSDSEGEQQSKPIEQDEYREETEEKAKPEYLIAFSLSKREIENTKRFLSNPKSLKIIHLNKQNVTAINKKDITEKIISKVDNDLLIGISSKDRMKKWMRQWIEKIYNQTKDEGWCKRIYFIDREEEMELDAWMKTVEESPIDSTPINEDESDTKTKSQAPLKYLLFFNVDEKKIEKYRQRFQQNNDIKDLNIHGSIKLADKQKFIDTMDEGVYIVIDASDEYPDRQDKEYLHSIILNKNIQQIYIEIYGDRQSNWKQYIEEFDNSKVAFVNTSLLSAVPSEVFSRINQFFDKG